jgi:RecA-family ATPase
MVLNLVMLDGRKLWGFEPSGPVNTLFLEHEGGEKPLAQRFVRLKKTIGSEMNARGWFGHITGLTLDVPKDVDYLCSFIAENNIKALFLDSLSKSLSTTDENSSNDINSMFKAAEKFRQLGCATIFIHHYNKPGRDRKGAEVIHDIDHMLRGSGAIAANYDVHIACLADPGSGTLTWERRSKDFEEKTWSAEWYIDPDDPLGEATLRWFEVTHESQPEVDENE